MDDENTAVTAACIWENVLEMRDEPLVAKAFDERGTCEIRDRVLDYVGIVNMAYDSLETCDVDDSEHYCPFDWGFVPFCVEKFFNWTTVSWEKIPFGETLAKMIREHTKTRLKNIETARDHDKMRKERNKKHDRLGKKKHSGRTD